MPGVIGQAQVPGRRCCAPVAGPADPHHPEPVARQLVAERPEPVAEDPCVHQQDRLAVPGVVVADIAAIVQREPPEFAPVPPTLGLRPGEPKP